MMALDDDAAPGLWARTPTEEAWSDRLRNMGMPRRARSL